jgi:hypothetical protein
VIDSAEHANAQGVERQLCCVECFQHRWGECIRQLYRTVSAN